MSNGCWLYRISTVYILCRMKKGVKNNNFKNKNITQVCTAC